MYYLFDTNLKQQEKKENEGLSSYTLLIPSLFFPFSLFLQFKGWQRTCESSGVVGVYGRRQLLTIRQSVRLPDYFAIKIKTKIYLLHNIFYPTFLENLFTSLQLSLYNKYHTHNIESPNDVIIKVFDLLRRGRRVMSFYFKDSSTIVSVWQANS